MDREELKSLLGRQSETPAPRGLCPGDGVLASYVEGALGPAEHSSFESHLADCPECMARVGMLGRERDSSEDIAVPDTTMARARRLVTRQAPGVGRYLPATRWAAAAVVLLLIGFAFHGKSPGPTTAETAGSPTLRNIKPLHAGPELLWPAEGARLDADKAAFNWTPVRDTIYYQVRVVSDTGDLLWQERVDGTQWRLPPELVLDRDRQYFFRVDAYLAAAKRLSSDFVAFSTEGKP